MQTKQNNFVDIHYIQSGKSANTDELGMREMQAKAYGCTPFDVFEQIISYLQLTTWPIDSGK